MLSFSPSFALATLFLVIFVECRTMAGRATLPLAGLTKFFIFGCVGASLLCLLVQQSPMLRFDSNFAGFGAWLAGPPIEELATAIPVLWLAFFTTVWRRLSVADLVLVGFTSGAGFAFVKSNVAALSYGALPSFDLGIALGLQNMQGAGENDVVFFSGYAVNAALLGLAAGIGLRLYPVHRALAWIPAAGVFIWACFDHGMYNWKVYQHALGAHFPQAPTPVEFLYLLTLHGQLAVWIFPVAFIAAQIVEAKLCTRLLGKRSDLLLPFERGRFVLNEWFVAFVHLWSGRAAFELTLAFFRHRRQFALASLEARRDPGNRALAQYTRVLEQRLVRERAILFEPPRGAWFPPRATLARNVMGWAWRFRWVFAFGVSCVCLFMVSPGQLPSGLQIVLYGDAVAALVVAIGLGVGSPGTELEFAL